LWSPDCNPLLRPNLTAETTSGANDASVVTSRRPPTPPVASVDGSALPVPQVRQNHPSYDHRPDGRHKGDFRSTICLSVQRRGRNCQVVSYGVMENCVRKHPRWAGSLMAPLPRAPGRGVALQRQLGLFVGFA